MISKKKQIDEIRKCAKDPVYFFKNYVKISHPTQGPVPFKTFPFQDQCAQDFINNRFVVVNKARQLGLSTLTAAYVAWLALFRKNKEILIIATKLLVAQNFIRKVKFVIQSLPSWLAISKIKSNNKTTIEFSSPSCSRVQAVPTSPDAGRSEALSLLIIDEAAHVRDMDELWKGLWPTLSTGGRAILLSTPNGQGNKFHEICTKAQAGDNDFKYVELPWSVHPDRDQKWFENETKSMTKQGVAQELLCDFLASGDTYLHIEEINWVKDNIRPPVRREGDSKNIWVWHDPVNDPSVKYLLCGDASSGVGKDYSTFHIFNKMTGEQAAEFKGKIRPDHFGDTIYKYAKKYNDALVCIERNSGYGQHVNTQLISNLGYTNVYFPKDKNVAVGGYIPEGSVSNAGFNTTPQSRPKILAKMEEVLRNKQVQIYSSRLYDELKSFVMLNNKPQAQRNCNDDLVMALAIGMWIFDVSGVHSQFASKLNSVMLECFGMSKHSYDEMDSNISSNQNAYNMLPATDSKKDKKTIKDPYTDHSWLFWK